MKAMIIIHWEKPGNDFRSNHFFYRVQMQTKFLELLDAVLNTAGSSFTFVRYYKI